MILLSQACRSPERTRRGRSSGSVVLRQGKWVTKVYDSITIDDVMLFLSKSEAAKQATGKGTTPVVPKQVKDYLAKQGATLPEK